MSAARTLARAAAAVAFVIAGACQGALSPDASAVGPHRETAGIQGSPNVRVCARGVPGSFAVTYDDGTGPATISTVPVAAGACTQVAGAGLHPAKVRVTEQATLGAHVDSILKDSLNWSTSDSVRLPARTGTQTDSVFLSGGWPGVGGILTFFNAADPTLVIVCTRGPGATFALTGGILSSLALGANQCRTVGIHTPGGVAVAVRVTENVAAGTALDSIVTTGTGSHVVVTGRNGTTAIATDGSGARVIFYNHVVTQTFVTVCLRGTGATVRLTGAATASPFIANGQCEVAATHAVGTPPSTLQATELVPTGFVLDSIVTTGAFGRAGLTGKVTASATANDAGGSTMTFYNHLH